MCFLACQLNEQFFADDVAIVSKDSVSKSSKPTYTRISDDDDDEEDDAINSSARSSSNAQNHGSGGAGGGAGGEAADAQVPHTDDGEPEKKAPPLDKRSKQVKITCTLEATLQHFPHI